MLLKHFFFVFGGERRMLNHFSNNLNFLNGVQLDGTVLNSIHTHSHRWTDAKLRRNLILKYFLKKKNAFVY